MRIVIDMQGAQTESRYRGIGRYTMSLTEAIVRNRGEHEIILALNGLFPETIEPIRSAFDGLLPQENIRVWYAPGPVRECEPGNGWQREVAEYIREAFLLSLQPNIVLITSLFEGLGDDAVTSIGILDEYTPTAVILYDLIPLISPDIHFQTSELHKNYYARKIASLRRSNRLLAISENSRGEALSALEFEPERVTTIFAGCDPRFHRLDILDQEKNALSKKFRITKPFLMYTGGADERKNLPRLIRAFADLPKDLREAHQLVIVGKMPDDNVTELQMIANKSGLTPTDVVFTGHVSDTELVQFYGLCTAFIFPSLYEGFGLPPLEAMACGAPVITANVTSLPEVVGRDDAMFDPLSISSISNKVHQVLTDKAFRQDLVQYGLERVRIFSWARCAKIAIATLESTAAPAVLIDGVNGIQEANTKRFSPQRKRILVSKLDHMGDFVLAIPSIMKLRARYPYAHIDALVGSWNEELAHSLGVFDHIYVYDFFAKESFKAPGRAETSIESLVQNVESYDLAIDLRRQRDTRYILLRIPSRMYVGYACGDKRIDDFLNVCLPAVSDKPFVETELNRVPITQQMLNLVDALPQDVNDYIRLPELVSRTQQRTGWIAIFPKAGSNVKEWGDRNFMELIGLLAAIPEVLGITVYIVNAKDSEPYQSLSVPKIHILSGLTSSELLESLSRHSVCVANNSLGAHIASYLGLRVVAVYAGHETVAEWAPVFSDSAVIHRPVECSPCHIAHRDHCQYNYRCVANISPDYVCNVVGRMLVEGVNVLPIKTIDDMMRELIDALTEKIAQLSDPELCTLSDCLSRTFPRGSVSKQLFVDVSMLVHYDDKTGIQRVVRSYLKEWLRNPPTGYSVEPVYATVDEGYRYARRFTRGFLCRSDEGLDDEPIEYSPGDIFFGLDLQPQVIPAHRTFFQELRRHGVRVEFLVHDLLCIRMPQYFLSGSSEAFTRWLEVVAESDGAVCVSKTVADQLAEWATENGSVRQRPFRIKWSHNGADIQSSALTNGFPDNANIVLDRLRSRSSFLMVGTLEPRKGHVMVLEAFDHLWRSGFDANLVIIGKQGWMVENLIDRIRSHPELNKRLFWLEGISDEYLLSIYATSTCLIAASEGEGFGLPLIEAAQHKLPIIARDIPVHREVAGQYAYYFDGNTAGSLVLAIRRWMELYKVGRHPRSNDMPWLTWEESAQRLVKIILSNNPQQVTECLMV